MFTYSVHRHLLVILARLLFVRLDELKCTVVQMFRPQGKGDAFTNTGNNECTSYELRREAPVRHTGSMAFEDTQVSQILCMDKNGNVFRRLRVVSLIRYIIM